MFRSWSKTRNIVTLFHKPSVPSSVRVLNLLNRASEKASEKASEADTQGQAQRADFDLQVEEQLPTVDQLKTILEYLGPSSAGKIVKGANDENTAIQALRENGDNFERPLVVDWNNGRAVAGANESAILKMLNELPK